MELLGVEKRVERAVAKLAARAKVNMSMLLVWGQQTELRDPRVRGWWFHYY